jgi:hypothetical protein
MGKVITFGAWHTLWDNFQAWLEDSGITTAALGEAPDLTPGL